MNKFVVVGYCGGYGYSVDTRGSNKNLSFTENINAAEIFTERKFKTELSDSAKKLVLHKLPAEETRTVRLIKDE